MTFGRFLSTLGRTDWQTSRKKWIDKHLWTFWAWRGRKRCVIPVECFISDELPIFKVRGYRRVRNITRGHLAEDQRWISFAHLVLYRSKTGFAFQILSNCNCKLWKSDFKLPNFQILNYIILKCPTFNYKLVLHFLEKIEDLVRKSAKFGQNFITNEHTNGNICWK